MSYDDIVYIINNKEKIQSINSNSAINSFVSSGFQGISGEIGVGPPGIIGFQGFAGPKGEAGEIGPTGIQGTQGATGATGADGDIIVGPTGPQGTQGVSGFQGLQGDDSNPGAQGTQGAQGAQGAQGPGEDTYLGLDDTPSTFTANRLITVNSGGSATSHNNLGTLVSSANSTASSSLIVSSNNATISSSSGGFVASSTKVSSSSLATIISSQDCSGNTPIVSSYKCTGLNSGPIIASTNINGSFNESGAMLASKECQTFTNISSGYSQGTAFATSFGNIISSSDTDPSDLQRVSIISSNMSSSKVNGGEIYAVSSFNCYHTDNNYSVFYASSNCKDQGFFIGSSSCYGSTNSTTDAIIASNNSNSRGTLLSCSNCVDTKRLLQMCSSGCDDLRCIASRNNIHGSFISGLNSPSIVACDESVSGITRNSEYSQITASKYCEINSTSEGLNTRREFNNIIGASYSCVIEEFQRAATILSSKDCYIDNSKYSSPFTEKYSQFIIASSNCGLNENTGERAGFIACSGISGATNQAEGAVSIACSYANTNNFSVRVKAMTAKVSTVGFSDKNFKKDITEINWSATILEDLEKLNLYKFNYYQEINDHPRHTGFIAQEVKEIFPEVVVDKTYKTDVVKKIDEKWVDSDGNQIINGYIDQEDDLNGKLLIEKESDRMGIQVPALQSLIWQSLRSMITINNDLKSKAKLFLSEYHN